MTLKPLKSVLLISLALFGPNQLVQADLIWIRDKPQQPIAGQVTSQTKTHIEFRPFLAGKYQTTKRIASENIEQTITTIDQDRLEKLNPKSPEGYRDYAEELAAHSSDPAAIDMANRLYLLSAYHSSGPLRSSSILGLISLAKSEENLHQLNLLLLIKCRGTTDFKRHLLTGSRNEAPTKLEKQLMLQLILALRQEQAIEASKILESAKNRNSISKWNNHLTLAEFDQIAFKNRPNKLQLSKLLAIEVMIRQSDSANVVPLQQGWGDLAMRPSKNLGVLPTFKNVTRFAPEDSIFRNGQWLRPDKN